MKIINKNYNIKGSINTNIVLISDIHYYNKKDLIHLNKVFDNIKKIKPDFICIPGDLTDESNVYDEKYLVDKYSKQLELYKTALEQALKKSVSKVYIYSTFLDKSIKISGDE